MCGCQDVPTGEKRKGPNSNAKLYPIQILRESQNKKERSYNRTDRLNTPRFPVPHDKFICSSISPNEQHSDIPARYPETECHRIKKGTAF
jgi:hypothetical protein